MKPKALFLSTLTWMTLLTQTALAGGVSGGGGGGAIVAPLAAPSDIRWESTVAKRTLALLFNGMEYDYQIWKDVGKQSGEPDLRDPVFEKIFYGPRPILQVIREAKIELSFDGPCIAPDGSEVDGSAPGSSADSICISIKRISEKLRTDNFRSQTLALIAHEFSHLAGTDETEAETLQTRAIERLFDTSDSEVEQLIDGSISVIQLADAYAQQLLEESKSGTDLPKFCVFWAEVSRSLRELVDVRYWGPHGQLSLFDTTESSRVSATVRKAINLLNGVCVQKAIAPDSDAFKSELRETARMIGERKQYLEAYFDI